MYTLTAGRTNPEAALKKTEFCNFIYSHRVRHRERFCQALSRYKPVRAPGKWMKKF